MLSAPLLFKTRYVVTYLTSLGFVSTLVQIPKFKSRGYGSMEPQENVLILSFAECPERSVESRQMQTLDSKSPKAFKRLSEVYVNFPYLPFEKRRKS